MTRKPGDNTPEPPGGRAAERLREFIDQRFPDGVPSPETRSEQAVDTGSDSAQDESGQHDESRLAERDSTE